MNNRNYNTLIYLLSCLIFLFVMCFIYFNYAKERKIFIQEAVNNFEKNTSLTISNFSLMYSQTNLNLENNNIKEQLDEVIKPHFDFLKSILKDGSDFGINTVSFWLAFLSLIMIIFTILGIFANNKILETNRKEAELNIRYFKRKSRNEFKKLKSNLLSKSKEVIEKIKSNIEMDKKEISDSVNSVKNIKNEADIFKSEILKIKTEAENILNQTKEQAKQSAQSANKSKVSELFSRALEESIKDNIDEAIKYYSELLELDKNNSAALNNRGILYMRKYTYTKNEEYFNFALNDYNNILSIDKKNSPALNNRGLLYNKKYIHTKNEEYFNSSLNDYNKVLEVDKEDLKVLNNRGSLHSEKYTNTKNKEYFDLAVNDYNRVLNIQYNDLDALVGRGWLYLVDYIIYKNIESLNNAEKDIKSGLYIDNSDLPLLNNNGIMLLFKYKIEKDIKLLDEAKKYLDKVVNNKSEKYDLGETYYYLSLLYKEYSQLENIEDTKKEEYKNKSEEAMKKSKELGYKSFIED